MIVNVRTEADRRAETERRSAVMRARRQRWLPGYVVALLTLVSVTVGGALLDASDDVMLSLLAACLVAVIAGVGVFMGDES